MNGAIKNTLFLCFLKTKILFNNLKNIGSLGKFYGMLCAAMLCIWGVADFSANTFFRLYRYSFGYDAIKVLLCFFVYVLLFIVFTGDLSVGNTVGTGQLSKDFSFLMTLPVKPVSIIFLKLYERMINDYFGILVMLSSFLGITLRDGFSAKGLLSALFLFFIFSSFIGLCVNVAMLILSQLFKKTAAENIISAVGYISAVSLLIPFLFFNSNPRAALFKLSSIMSEMPDYFDYIMTPTVWTADILIKKELCKEALYLFVFWAVLMTLGCFVYSLLLSKNRFSFKVSSGNSQSAMFSVFTGFFGKEFRLLNGDLGYLLNAVAMPITIIAAELYFMKKMIVISGIDTIMNVIFAAAAYFAVFGPLNSVGSEGKSIAIIESFPISPASLLLRKFSVWLVIAESLFFPVSVGVTKNFGYSTLTAFKYSWIAAMFIAVCVFAAICVSALSANYEAKTLPQRSGFGGKIAVLALASVAAPISKLDFTDVSSAVVFVLLLVFVWKKAVLKLKYRLDLPTYERNSYGINLTLIVLSYFAGVLSIFQVLECFNLTPGLEVGHWPYTVPLALILPLLIMTVIKRPKK